MLEPNGEPLLKFAYNIDICKPHYQCYMLYSRKFDPKSVADFPCVNNRSQLLAY